LRGHISKVGLGILIASLLVVPSLTMTMHAKGEGEPVSWTFAVYLNGDNNLERYWEDFSRPALQNIPANSDVNFVVMMDWVAQNGSSLYEISGGVVTLVDTYEEMNYGDGATFQWFITEITTLYPSDKLGITMWDHGYAWRYISDDSTSDDAITMDELQTAIEGAGVFIDILSFDACNMAAVEVVYEVAQTGLVDLMVASEDTIPENGFPYDLMWTQVAQDPTRTPVQVAVDMVDGWAAYYDPLSWATTVGLSAIDVGVIGSSIATLDTWIAEMHANLGAYAKYYKTALSDAYSAWATYKHVDMADLGDTLLANSKISDADLRTATANMVALVDSAVLALSVGSGAEDARGLTIWWGVRGDWSFYSPAYAEVDFAVDLGWYDFLVDYN
jgi:hypothetical protein